MKKILVVLAALALCGGGIYWYVTQTPAPASSVMDEKVFQQSGNTSANSAAKNSTGSTNAQVQPSSLALATHKRQLFWMMKTGQTAYATDNKFSSVSIVLRW